MMRQRSNLGKEVPRRRTIADAISARTNFTEGTVKPFKISPNSSENFTLTSTNNFNKNQQKKSTSMKSLFKGLNLEFGKYNNNNIAYSFAGIAVKRRDGQFVVFNRETQTLIEVGDMKFDVDFYQIPVQALSQGDITVIDGQVLIVEKILDNGNIQCINPATGSKTTKVKRTNLFNMYFYTKIVSMFDMFNGGNPAQGANAAGPLGNLNPMMLMMAMGGENGGDSSSLMEMMLMSQMFGGAGAAGAVNPFAALLGGQQPTAQQG